MSRRKQTKPHHWHSDSDEDGSQKTDPLGQLDTEPQTDVACDSPTTITTSTSATVSADLHSSVARRQSLKAAGSGTATFQSSGTNCDTINTTDFVTDTVQTTISSSDRQFISSSKTTADIEGEEGSEDILENHSVQKAFSDVVRRSQFSGNTSETFGQSFGVSFKRPFNEAGSLGEKEKHVMQSSSFSVDTYHESRTSVSSTSSIIAPSAGIATTPKKRGRPLSLPFPTPVTTSPASVTLSPRRQSLRLQQTQAKEGGIREKPMKDMSHRTCQYCGVVKPTPAALQRHIRKHTGERPFSCHVCNKAYKAKRSLHLHQMANHPQLFDPARNGLDSSNSGHDLSSSTVSSNTTHLLRETLETKRLGRLPEDGEASNADSFTGREIEENSDDTTGEMNMSARSSPSSINNSLASLDHSTDRKTPLADDQEGEEIGDKKSCPYCFKVCSKPSDMKRHLMVHTGERPFLCQVCQKRFKQKGSLLYHQKAAHNLNVELSQGLEERYLRLKTRSAMRSLAALDSLSQHVPQDSVMPRRIHSPGMLSAGKDHSQDAFDTPYTSSHIIKGASPFSATDSDLYQGLKRPASHASDGFWGDDYGNTAGIVEVDIPEEFSDSEPGDSNSGQQTKKMKVAVHSEAVLVTKLEGVCVKSGNETSLFRCYLCGKISVALHHLFSHLAAHFDPRVMSMDIKAATLDPKVMTLESEDSRVMTFDCKICPAEFASQDEMADHLRTKHNLSPRDLSNNNHSRDTKYHRSNSEENLQASKFKHPGKASSGFDDLNNNNDSHINKETASAESSETTSPESLLKKSENAQEASTSGDVSEKDLGRWSVATHTCMICRKGFTSQYLLMRHMHLHKQQLAIEAVKVAMYSGASTNGFHQEMLLKPPAVLPQNSEGVDTEIQAFMQGKSPKKSFGLEGLQTEKMKNEISGGSEEKQEKGEMSDSDVENAKLLLEKEGIKEDVTVVLPSDPDAEKEDHFSPLGIAGSRSEENLSEDADGEIRSAPKRSLMPSRKEGPPVKSRRKATLPTRINHEVSFGNRPPPVQMVPLSPSPPPLQIATEPQSGSEPHSREETEISLGPHNRRAAQNRMESREPTTKDSQSPPLLQDGDESMSSDRSRSPERMDESRRNTDRTQSEEDLLLARQAKYVQSLHSAFGGSSQRLSAETARVLTTLLPPGVLANGIPPQASLTMAARLFGPFTGVSPSFPSHSTMHDPSASSSSVRASNSPSPLSHASGSRGGFEEQTQAEDLSLSSSSLVSDSHTPSHSALSPNNSTSHRERETLVGYPRVLWPQAGDGNPARDATSPASQHSLSPTTSKNGKHLGSVWHTFTSEDLSNGTVTDGRKVTSLSRTHSRLYVVNQPVDRERLCKPTELSDGRTVYRCVFCHKDFLSYSDINRHMDFHEDIRPYKCNFCDYYARTNSQLKVHMMRHQGIREYCCRLCNYKGVTQSDLNRHMKSQIHLLKSRNECTRCGEGFVTSKNLEKHISAICTGKHKMDLEDEMQKANS